MTTARLVNEWEEYCEANSPSKQATERIEKAKALIRGALDKIREAEGLLSTAVGELDLEEIWGSHDRIDSFLSELENIEFELENQCDDL